VKKRKKRKVKPLATKPTFQAATTKSPTQLRLPPPLPARHRWWRRSAWVGGSIAIWLGVMAAVDQFWGRPWPTDPEIHPLDFVSGTPLTHLFKVQNRSLFDMDDIEFTCGVDLMALKDADGHMIGGSDMAFVNATYSIPRGQSINYSCDASRLVEAKADGSLSYRQSMVTKPGIIRPPLSISKMCLWVGGKYHLFGRNWTFRSIIFKWPSSQSDPHWVEGPIAQEVPRERGPPGDNVDALECSPSIRSPLMLFKGEGRPSLVGDYPVN
jgi:hypothetical protein